MFRRIIPIVLLLLVTLAGAYAQPDNDAPLFSAVAYLPETGKLVLVNDTSVASEITVPLQIGRAHV